MTTPPRISLPSHEPHGPRNAWRGLLVAFLATFLELVGYFMLEPLLLLTLTQRGVAPGIVGLFAAMGWLAILAVTPLAARIAHALGPRPTFWVSGMVPLGCAIAFALTHSIVAWFAICMILGLASGLRWIVAEAMVAELAPAQRRGRIVGLFQTMIGLTFIAGPALLSATGTAGMAPFLGAIALLALGSLVSLALPKLHAEVHGDATPDGFRGVWLAIKTSPEMMVAAFVGGIFEAGVSGLLPIYGLAIGMSAAHAALLVSASGVGSTVMMLPTGDLADRIGRRSVALGCVAASLIASLALPLAPQASALAWVIAFVWGGAGGSLYTLAMIDAGARLKGPALVNAAAVVVMSYTLGGTVAPALGGFALEQSARWGLPLLFVLIAGVGWIWMALRLRDAATH